MRLLAIVHHLDPTETGLFGYLAKQGIEVKLITHPDSPDLDKLSGSKVGLRSLEIKSRFDRSAVRHLRDELQVPYDCVYAPTSRGITSIISAYKTHPAAFITYRGTMGHLSRWSLLSRRAHLHPRVDAILCNCNAVRDFMLSVGVPCQKLHTIYKGHDPAWYTNQSESEEWSRRTKKYISCIANIRKCKGVDVLLKSFAHARANLKDLKLVIAGKVSDKRIPGLINSLNLQDSVELLGFRSDTQQIIKHSLFTVIPSVSREGVPRAMIEAMSHSVPSIGTDIGGMPEIIRNNETGIIIPPSNVEALSNAMISLADSPEKIEKYGKAARMIVESELSVELFSQHFLRMANEAIRFRKSF